MPYLKTKDGTSLSYTCWGAGKTLLLIHGWAMGSDMWEYQIPHLTAKGLRCITYDQRGCGRSDQPGHGYDFDTLADDLATVIEQLDLRDATLAGFSLGGAVVARYLARHGADRVARTVLVGSNTPFLLKGDDNPEGMDRSLVYDPFRAGIIADRPQYLKAVAGPFFGDHVGVKVSEGIQDWAVGLCLQSSATGMLELYRAVNETDFRPDMAAFTVPTLIIHGDSDPFQPLEITAKRSAAAIKNSRLEVYQKASHGLFYTHRDRLNQDLLTFTP
ncbi:MAG TPA: alpha/beta hydrolase [Bryobacteraceae bacterium]|nr:alpha/beta hydrolase [Bryobacteraceae bacterium]